MSPYIQGCSTTARCNAPPPRSAASDTGCTRSLWPAISAISFIRTVSLPWSNCAEFYLLYKPTEKRCGRQWRLVLYVIIIFLIANTALFQESPKISLRGLERLSLALIFRRNTFERVGQFWAAKTGVWCALDFEAWERDHSATTEFGYSLIYWKNGEEVKDYGHFTVRESRALLNGRYVPERREVTQSSRSRRRTLILTFAALQIWQECGDYND